MANMLDKLNSEVSNNGGNDFGNRTPQNGVLRLGRKYSENVRIIPYPDRDFWYPYRTLWVDFDMGGNTVSTVLTFTYNDNHDDKLRTLAGKIIKYNFQYRKDSQQDKTRPDFTGDKIPLQFPKANKPHYNATLRPMFALQAIKIVQGADGQPTMQTISGSDIPLAQIMNVPKSVMGIIANSISSNDDNVLESYADKDTGKPYKLDSTTNTELRWINTGKSFPVFIHLNSDNRYEVNPHNLQTLPPLNKQLYAKDANGKYVHLDDPAYIYEPTKTRAPKIWNTVYNQLKARWDKEQSANGGKNYAQATINQAKSVQKNVQNDNSQTSATANQSNPYDRSAQPSATGQSANGSSSNPVNSTNSVSSVNSDSDRPSGNGQLSSASNSNAPTNDDSKSIGSTAPQQSQDKSQVGSGDSEKAKLDKMDPNAIINNALKGGN